MEGQINQHNGAKAREFHAGDPVLVLKFHGHGCSWVPGTMTQRPGHVLHELTVHVKKETYHINHTRRRDPNICDRPEDIKILLDGFELPTHTTENNTEENMARENPIIEARRSRRTRAPIKRLNVDPSKRSYE
ncbi:hypothetical protein PHET_02628 [Paragonimus heterotremus]|uniref:Uncharacterized protein n=1 Tax=Paragonimus heterotremus TaxID=100268 RepID=A0A8J4TKL4_9TREM|nr:hypothetical protein PHET_02628 [Paragonimus heterotremus]